MRYPPIDQSLFKANRQRLASRLPSGSLVILHSADPLRLSGDGVLPFRQDSNFYYLTGIGQEESILLMFPDHPDPAKREVLLIQETNEFTLTWEGYKLSHEEAAQLSGISRVEWLPQLDDVFNDLLGDASAVYMDFTDEERFPENRNSRKARAFRSGHPKIPCVPLEPEMKPLRMIKHPIEIDLITRAGEITKTGYEKVMQCIEPDVWEYEIEAQFTAEFVSRGSRGFAYNPIVASGPNACVLHYEQNNRRCREGDLVLLDIGAEYAHYAADVTRTFPVSGVFTDRQKQVYQAVLAVKKFATEILRPGITIKDYSVEVGKVMEEQLMSIGLLSDHEIKSQDARKPAYKKFYMHGTSHHLGLDVHDLSDRSTR